MKIALSAVAAAAALAIAPFAAGAFAAADSASPTTVLVGASPAKLSSLLLEKVRGSVFSTSAVLAGADSSFLAAEVASGWS